MNRHDKYMRMALDLASQGWGRVSPNPMVGALIVKNGRVIAEGYHSACGRAHAEVVALKTAGKKAKGATLIVNLEPCCHFGRTPPCTDAIIKSGIKKVVYGVKDPNRAVSGKGLQILRKSGIDIVGPILKNECISLNRIYFHWMKNKTPFVISKVALSLDGKIATSSGDSKWLTGKNCRQRAHYWRSGVDAILVGAETVRKDDPLLTARGIGKVRQPIPVIISSNGNIPRKSKVLKRDPIIFTGKNLKWKNILAELGERGISSVLVEGGGRIHAQLLALKIPSYMVAMICTKLIGGKGIDWFSGIDIKKVKLAPRIKPDQISRIDDDIVIEGEILY